MTVLVLAAEHDFSADRMVAALEHRLEQVYRNEPFVTAVATTTTGHQVTVSSSTKPGLMIRMLEALDIDDGHRVLEIGTGTGYNAALLCHRLGDRQVHSVDIGPGLVSAARRRLGGLLGYSPVLVVTDGTAGLPGHGPYDRIIATCSVPEIPWAWAEQLRPGGLLLADLKRTVHAGNLVLLKRHEDRLEGRFLPHWAAFMAIRHTDNAPETRPIHVNPGTGTPATTPLDPLPWNSLVPWFLAQADLPAGVTFGYRGVTGTGPAWAVFTAPDGSWCTVRTQPGDNGQRDVLQDGPTAIWHHVETATEVWVSLDRPGWERLGLTAYPGRPHRIWLDHPDNDLHWDMRF